MLVATVLSVGATMADRFPGDRRLSGWVQGADSAALDALSSGIYLLGFWPFILVAGFGMAAACWHCGHRLAATFVGAAVLAQGLSTLLKVLIERPRPSADLVRVIGEPSGFSFPSGHVLAAVVLWGFVAFLAPRIIKHRAASRTVQVLALTVVGLMGLQRVYAGAHWPSDVVGGYLWGALVLALLAYGYQYARGRSVRGRPDASRRGHPKGS